ncbi:30S ribosomal protein S8 [Candidatus Saccharibacteria bacterium]|nr:30S ribosomal protein S8 [Candidatus Saccharibacteria bacterium]
MVSTDPIADMLSRIRNAMMVNKDEIRLPHSILKERVAEILKSNGFLQQITTTTEKNRKYLVISINDSNYPSSIAEIGRLSRPGRRTYINSKKIPYVKRGRGIIIISTSKGLMTGQEAKSKNLGGELICEVY